MLRFYGIFWDLPTGNNAPVVDYYMVSEACVGGNLHDLLYNMGADTRADGAGAQPNADDAEDASFDATHIQHEDWELMEGGEIGKWKSRPRLSDQVFRQLLMEILSGTPLRTHYRGLPQPCFVYMRSFRF